MKRMPEAAEKRLTADPSGTLLVRLNRSLIARYGVFWTSVGTTSLIATLSFLFCVLIYRVFAVDYLNVPIAIIMPIAAPILTGFPPVFLINRLVEELMQREQLNKQQREELSNLALEAARQRNVALRANAAKSTLLANMSHELRTPLNAIIGFSDIFRSKMFDDLDRAHIQQYAEDINVSGQLLLSLVNDLLELARIEGGGREFFIESVDLKQKAEEVLRILQPQASDAGVLLNIADGLPDLTLQTDDRALRQMLLNLISNAIKFTPREGEIRVHWQLQNDETAVAVSDNGIGIGPDELGRIFEPFSQVDNLMTRSQAGTGLGLALVKTMIEQLGGRIEVKSEVGQGSVFTLLFPASVGNIAPSPK